MKRYLNGQDLLNGIILESSASPALYLVVEGEDDFDILIDHANQSEIELVVGYGKPSLLEAATLADSYGFNRAEYLVDSDFDAVTGRSTTYAARVVATSHYDLVMDMHHKSPSIAERLARKITRTSDMVTRYPAGPAPIIDVAMRAGALVGAVRLASETNAWSLKTDKFPMEDAVAQALGLSGRQEAVLDRVELRTPGGIPDRSALAAQVKLLLVSVSPDVLVNGHDFLRAIAAACRLMVGQTKGANLEEQFAVAADCRAVHGHPWWRDIEIWTNRYGATAFHAAA